MVKILTKYMKLQEWLAIAFCLVLIVGQVYLDLKLPDYSGQIANLVQNGIGTMGDVWTAGAKMIGCALGSFALAIFVSFFASRTAASFSRRARQGIFEKVESLSAQDVNRFSTASLLTRTTNDVTQIQMLIGMGTQMLLKAPVLAVWAVIKIYSKSFQWSLLTAVAVLIMLVMMALIFVFVVPRFKKIQKLTDNLNKVTRENLTGLRVVKAYNAEGYQEEKFAKANNELYANNLFTSRFTAILSPVISCVMSMLSLGIYWIAAYLIDGADTLQQKLIFSGDMVTFSSYAMQVIMAFMMLAMIFVLLPRASVSAKRINEVLDVEPSVKDFGASAQSSYRAELQKGTNPAVEFRNVGFKYPDAEEYVLKDISFSIKKGQTIAFIGSTGSGKSTLINLVPRFYDATDGQILVDGVDVKDYPLSDLYNKLGYVPQKGVLFAGSIESNVFFGESAAEKSEDALWNALKISQASDFVEKMDGQSSANISQGGTNVSGGQKQRLSIARAVARKPEIYIFDDTFSALDYKTDKLLREALKREAAGSTVLIVAQRIGTIKNADKIVVLEQGRLAGIGTHKELLQSCDVYREIAYSQLSKEELEK